MARMTPPVLRLMQRGVRRAGKQMAAAVRQYFGACMVGMIPQEAGPTCEVTLNVDADGKAPVPQVPLQESWVPAITPTPDTCSVALHPEIDACTPRSIPNATLEAACREVGVGLQSAASPALSRSSSARTVNLDALALSALRRDLQELRGVQAALEGENQYYRHEQELRAEGLENSIQGMEGRHEGLVGLLLGLQVNVQGVSSQLALLQRSCAHLQQTAAGLQHALLNLEGRVAALEAAI